ncbi:MAG: ADP-ribosylglycohydrolase family protein [Eubacteriales bacterium]
MDKATLYDKIYACWLGKNIGGTLGEPVEGRKELMNLTFFPRLSETGDPLPNDDLDLQLVNLHAVEQYGINLTCAELGREWTEHVYFPYDEYGYGATALRLGLRPPFSGKYDNPFTNCMGSPIRSELWAALAHGRPALAAYFAWQDAVVDHAGGEGLYGEMFYAALEAMAYERDVRSHDDAAALISDALAYVPSASRTYAALTDMLRWYREGVSYLAMRDKILAAHGRSNFTDAPQNIAFTMVGLLYGDDFGDGILKAVNLGYDTDCTGATLGALYGILYGRSYIPEKWSAPIGQRITVSAAVRGFDAPADLAELTERTIRLGDMLALSDEGRFKMTADEECSFDYQRFVFPDGASKNNNIYADISYPDGVCAVPYSDFTVDVKFVNNSNAKWTFEAYIDGGAAFTPSKRQIITAERAQSVSARFVIRAGELDITSGAPCGRAFRPSLVVRRINDGNLWADYRAPFTVLRAAKWICDGVERYIDGGELHFDSRDIAHTAETTLRNLSDRECRLMFASTSAVKVELDGNVIIDSAPVDTYMPAFHRCPGQQAPILPLYRGEHKIKVTVTGADAYFMFAPLATNKNTEPGAFYYYTDTVIG